MPAQHQKSFGPKTMVINTTAFGIIVWRGKEGVPFSPPNNIKQIGQADDAPRSKQSWKIESVYFTFPEAFQKGGKFPEADKLIMEYEANISLYIGGVEVASQKFLTLGPTSSPVGHPPVEEPFRCLGSLEPNKPAVVYPGQDVRIIATLGKYIGESNTSAAKEPTNEGELELNKGTVTITYTLDIG